MKKEIQPRTRSAARDAANWRATKRNARYRHPEWAHPAANPQAAPSAGASRGAFQHHHGHRKRARGLFRRAKQSVPAQPGVAPASLRARCPEPKWRSRIRHMRKPVRRASGARSWWFPANSLSYIMFGSAGLLSRTAARTAFASANTLFPAFCHEAR